MLKPLPVKDSYSVVVVDCPIKILRCFYPLADAPGAFLKPFMRLSLQKIIFPNNSPGARGLSLSFSFSSYKCLSGLRLCFFFRPMFFGL